MTDAISRLTSALSDRYRIERELGAGGMATVYLAHDLRHDRDVAIKVLHPELAAALGSDRFLSEIRTTARLQHPHILPLLDSGDAAGFLFYVMPYMSGETLRARLERERQLPVDDAVRIAREVADALGSAHAAGIIHRDIKPENILLQSGHALVADFGIALAVQHAGGTRMTQTGLSLGTPQYMSPEQALGERTIDLRSDIYALGAVTYEMLVGEPPFTGPTVQSIIARVMSEEPRSLTAQRRSVPPAVEQTVLRALEKLPADRFASAAEFVASLSGHGTAARTTRVRTRLPRALIGAALLAIALSAALGWFAGRNGIAGSRAGNAHAFSIVLPDSLPLDPMRGSSEGEPALDVSADGTMIVAAVRRGNTTQLALRRRDGFDLELLPGTEGAHAPFFSPRGEAIGFFTGTTLRRIVLADGQVNTVLDGLAYPIGGLWAEDDRMIVADRFGSHLISANPDGGERSEPIRCQANCAYPHPLPGGTHVLASPGGGLVAIELATGAASRIQEPGDTVTAQRIAGYMPHYDWAGNLVYVSPAGDVLAVPFDATTHRVTGAVRLLARGARIETGRGAAQLAVSRDGVIAYTPGPRMVDGVLIRVDRAGRVDTIPGAPANYAGISLSPDGSRIAASVRNAAGGVELRIIDATTGRSTVWLTDRADLSAPSWLPDGRRIVFRNGPVWRVGSPDLTAPPDSIPGSGGAGMVRFLADGTRYLQQFADSVVIRGEPASQPTVRSIGRGSTGIAVTTHDVAWLIAHETRGEAREEIATTLDGSGRRVHIADHTEMGQPESPFGSSELIMLGADGAIFSIAYRPGSENPFGAPVRLFRTQFSDFPGRPYAVGMAGRRFVFKRGVPDRAMHEIRLLHGWQRAEASR